MTARVPVRACIGLGANLPSAHGDAPTTLAWAVRALDAYPGTQLLRCSSLYRSAPVASAGPDFYNAVVEISTMQPASILIFQLLNTEQLGGRERPWVNAPRTLDLDLLLYGSGRIQSPALTVPHPRLEERAFVLRPLAELRPEWREAASAPRLAAQRVERTVHPVWPPMLGTAP